MIPINNLSTRFHSHRSELKGALDRVLASGWFVLGPELKAFESQFATYIGTEHCLGVANGTDAIELALKAMGITAQHRVATVANAGMYTTTALLAIGATPVFMDVDIHTHNVTLAEVQRVIEQGVDAVVVTHLYGLTVSAIKDIADLCRQHCIPLLEDCAQAHGAILHKQRVGSFGDAASFSFYPTKNLGAMGDAGAVLTSNPHIAERVAALRQYGWSAKYQVSSSQARNSRLDEVQAAVLSVFLPSLDAGNAQRRQIAANYNRGIVNPAVTTVGFEGPDCVAHLYVLRTTHRDSLRKHLQTQHIASDIHYPIPDHRQAIFADRFSSLNLRNTDILCREVLTIPCYPELPDTDVNHIIASINQWRP